MSEQQFTTLHVKDWGVGCKIQQFSCIQVYPGEHINCVWAKKVGDNNRI